MGHGTTMNNLWQPAIWLLSGVVAGSFLLVDSAGSLISWAVAFMMLLLICQMPERLIGSRGRFTAIIIISYLLISLAGLVEVGDNLRNFGTPFGKHADDSRFYEQTLSLLSAEIPATPIGFYERVLAFWGAGPTLVFAITPRLLDFLPLNWALGAVVVGLADILCMTAIAKRPPVWLLGACLLGNYKFLDTAIHLYRDVLLLVFFLGSMIAFMRWRPLLALFLAVPVLLLRGASFLILALFCGLFVLRGRFPHRSSFYAVCAAFSLLVIVVMPIAGNLIFRYGSSSTNVGGNVGLPTWSFSENLDFRANTIANYAAEGSTLSATLTGTDPASLLIRPAVYAFFPIRLWPLNMDFGSGATEAKMEYSHGGLYLYHVIMWVTVVSWIFIIPLIIIGLFVAMRGAATANVFFVFFILCVLSVSFISLQMRHGMAFVVITPVIVMLGLQMYCEHYAARRAIMGLGALVTLILLAYNIMNGGIL